MTAPVTAPARGDDTLTRTLGTYAGAARICGALCAVQGVAFFTWVTLQAAPGVAPHAAPLGLLMFLMSATLAFGAAGNARMGLRHEEEGARTALSFTKAALLLFALWYAATLLRAVPLLLFLRDLNS